MSCSVNSFAFVESEMGFWQGAARKHPRDEAVTELQRCQKAISGH